jgi:uncharacterized protein YjiS (DUF1127 family)
MEVTMKNVILEISGLGNADYRHRRQTGIARRHDEQMRVMEKRARRARAEAYRQVFGGLGRGIARAFQSIGTLADHFSRWRREGITIRELQALDDRLLRDIGLERSNIRRMVWGLAAHRSHAGAVRDEIAARREVDRRDAERTWRRAA